MGLYDFFSRVLVPVRQRPSSTDLNRLQTYLEQNFRWIQAGLSSPAWSGDPSTSVDFQARGEYAPIGFYRGGFYVTPGTGPLDVRVNAGAGCALSGPASATDIDSASGADWLQSSAFGAPLVLSAFQNFTCPASPAVGSSRIDIIEVRADYLAGSPATVGILNTATRVFDPTVKNKKLGWDLAGRTGTVNAPAASTAPISYVRGVTVVGALSAATEPAATSGYIKIGRINFEGAVAAVTQDLIADLRPKVYAGGLIHAAGRITIPGVVAGVASPNNIINALALPQGVSLKAAFYNPAPPAAGMSYTATCFLFGGDLTPRTLGVSSTVGSVLINGVGDLRVGRGNFGNVTRLTAAQRSILNGTDANYTLLDAAEDIAVGTPVFTFNVEVFSADGSALNATESASFHVVIGQG
jgi:hypothetical protein